MTLPSGYAGAPAISFNTDPTSGIFLDENRNISFCIGDKVVLKVGSDSTITHTADCTVDEISSAVASCEDEIFTVQSELNACVDRIAPIKRDGTDVVINGVTIAADRTVLSAAVYTNEVGGVGTLTLSSDTTSVVDNSPNSIVTLDADVHFDTRSLQLNDTSLTSELGLSVNGQPVQLAACCEEKRGSCLFATEDGLRQYTPGKWVPFEPQYSVKDSTVRYGNNEKKFNGTHINVYPCSNAVYIMRVVDGTLLLTTCDLQLNVISEVKLVECDEYAASIDEDAACILAYGNVKRVFFLNGVCGSVNTDWCIEECLAVCCVKNYYLSLDRTHSGEILLNCFDVVNQSISQINKLHVDADYYTLHKSILVSSKRVACYVDNALTLDLATDKQYSCGSWHDSDGSYLFVPYEVCDFVGMSFNGVLARRHTEVRAYMPISFVSRTIYYAGDYEFPDNLTIEKTPIKIGYAVSVNRLLLL